MRKKIIASIILIIMLLQSMGNCCLAVVNEISMNESSQEANNIIADNEIETNNILSENTVQTTNVTETTNTTSVNETSIDTKTVTNNKLETSNSNEIIEIGDQYITEDDLLYSNKYLVKNKVVSRIDPKTTILEFKQGVEIANGNEIKFYRNDGITEVTQGILGTGMFVRGTNGQEYKLSVKGDMTGEGESNQVELTMLIRHIIDLQGWKLTDINAVSGDITGDGEINLVDVDKMIKHIVYKDWEYDTRVTPNPPAIEVIGREGEEVDLYTSEVRVRVVEDKTTQNLKTTYKLSGSVEKEETAIDDDDEITLIEDGEYLITAYTYGVQGNRSKASNRRIVIKNEKKPELPEIYNIKYELNGGTNSSENSDQYTYGEEKFLKDPTREGYTFEGWYKEPEFVNKIEKIEPTQTGDITVYAKWSANKYNIKYELNGGTNSSENSDQYTYGEEKVLKDPTKEGYTFEGWYKEPEFVNKIEKIESTQTGDITVYAKWSANKYNIKYELNGGTNSLENSDQYTYGEEKVLKDPTKEGYTFEGWYKELEFVNKIEKIEPTQTGGITAYAKWKQNEYKIQVMPQDGGIVENQTEIVKHGENSTKQIKIIPNTHMQVDTITINGVQLLDYEQDEETGIVILPIFENVTEDKNIVVTFREILLVVKIIDAPEGYENLVGKEYASITKALEDITIDGVTLQLIADTKEEVTLTNRQITLDLNGKSVKGDRTTVTIENSNLTLINSNSSEQGKIISSTKTAIHVKDNGIFNFGKNEGTVEIDKMLIQGETSGVKNEGTFNFYDGTIIGIKAIDGDTTDVPLRYNVSIGVQDGKQVAILQVMASAEAAIGQKTFFKLEDAIAYANESIATDGSQVEVTIIDNVQKTETVEVADSKNIKINLNGYEVSFLNGDDGIKNYGKLEIVDTIGTGKITSTMNKAISNNDGAELTITSGTIDATGNGSYGIYNTLTGTIMVTGGAITANSTALYIDLTGTGTVKVTGGTITSNTASAISNNGSGEVIVEGGTITGYTKGINNYNQGIVTVTGGTVTAVASGSYGIYNRENGTVRIDGETVKIESEAYGLYNVSAGTVIMNKGEIIGNQGITNKLTGTVTINGGKMTISGYYGYGIINESTGLVTINSVEINATDTDGKGIGIYNSDSGTVQMTGGIITSAARGIENHATGTIKVTGGTINAGTSAIYNYTTGTIIIGEKDGTASDMPNITGKNYGVYNESLGKINFYDGRIEGKLNQSLYGSINEIEDGYNIIQTIEDSREISTLGNIEYFKVVETNKLYSNLQDAIDSIDTDEVQTIQVLSNIIISADRGVTNDKNIVLDLNGKTIKAGKSGTIDNIGTLEIIDYSDDKTASIVALLGKAVVNEEGATLKITGGTIDNTFADTDTYNDTYAVENMGIMKVNGGTIRATGNSDSHSIKNNGAGTIDIGEGTISAIDGYGIYNNSTGTVRVNGGTITSDKDFGIYNNSKGIVLIDGGTIKGGIYNKIGTITVKNGDIIAHERSKGIENESGTITVEGGSISGGIYGIYNNSTEPVTVTGGTIQASSYEYIFTSLDGFGIYNNSTGTVIMTGGTIKTTSASTIRNTYGIFNYSTGTVKVTGGIIESEITDSRGYGIYNNSTGEVTIGEKGGDVSVTVPSIAGGNYGLYNYTTGTVNFYDGIIKGAEGKSIYGSLNEIEDEYDVVKTIDGVTGTENAILQKLAVIINTSTNTEYYSIQTAISEAKENETLQVVRNIVTISSDETIVVDASKNVVLDLNGYSIAFAQATAIRNFGKLIIADSSEGKTGNIISTVGNIITNEDGAILDITGGTIKTTESSSPAIYNDLSGVVTVEGGAIIATGTGIKTSETSTGMVKVVSGTITSNGASGIANNGSGEIIIEGGTVTGYTNGINNYSTGTVTINGGTVMSNGYYGANNGIYNNLTGTVRVNGGTVTSEGYYGSNYGIYNNSTGIVLIDGGTVTADSSVYDSYGIYNNSTGTVTIDSGAVTVKVDSGYGIYNNSDGKVTVNGGTVTSYHGIYNYLAGTVAMTGGTVISTRRGIDNNAEGIVIMTGGNITSGTSGIYNNLAGTITIGEKDGTVNDTNLSITGTNYGICNNSTGILNFYDGIIKGAIGQSIYGTVNEVEDEYDVIRTADKTTSTETAVLQQAPSVINKATSKEYYSLQTAITEAGENDTLQILRNIMILTTQETIVVEEDKDIVLDLNGYNVTFGPKIGIKNLGKLIIEDTSEDKTGNILSTVGNLITNEDGAILDIAGGTIKATESSSPAIYNDLSGIVTVKGGTIIASSTGIKTSVTSTGMVKVVSGTITSNGASGISNNGSGEIVIEDGTVTGYTNGINNYSTGTVTINGGTVISNGYYYNYGIYNNSTGIVIIDGGTVIADSARNGSYGIYNNLTGTVLLKSGTVAGADYGIYNYSMGTVTIDGGVVKATRCGIMNLSDGIVMVNGGMVIAEGVEGEGIRNSSTGTITIDGGIVKAAGSKSYGIYNDSGIITVNNGTVIAEGSSSTGIYNYLTGTVTLIGGMVNATESDSYGIYNYSEGIVTIGEKDGTVSTSIPSVTGTIYGIYNPLAGTLNFYDGIIKGSKFAIFENVTDIETNYQIKYSENNTVATLEPIATNYKVISIGEIYYETLQAAINDAKDGETIVLWADIILDKTVVVPEGLNVTIELNGNNLTGKELSVLINNRGTVNVVDSVGTGSISNPNGETIKNFT